jgi:hypothetical protein
MRVFVFYNLIRLLQKVLSFRFAADQLRSHMGRANRSPGGTTVSLIKQTPRVLTYQMVDHLLTSGDHLERFFNHYCVDYVPAQWHWRPMKIDKRSLKELFSTSSWALFTYDNERTADDSGKTATGQLSESRQVTSSTFTGDSQNITSISYSYFYPVKVGLACDVFFFGDNPSLAASHAIMHAERLVSIWKGNTVLKLHVGDRLDVDQINAEVEEILGRSCHVDTFIMRIRSLRAPDSKL